MKIDVNRVAAFLAGNFPPYYEQYSKIKFMKVLLSEASSVFPEKEEFNFIGQHSSSLQIFFKECLSLIEQEEILFAITEKLGVPDEAKGRDFIQIGKQKVEIKERTIGFITPFDKEKEYLKLKTFLEEILKKYESDYGKWEIKVSDFDISEGKKILWESVEDFLNKYPFYIANFRDNNLNVSLEVGYLLAKGVNFIPIVEEGEKVSDLDGFIRVSSKNSISKPWANNEAVTNSHASNKENFKERIEEQLLRYLKNHD